MKKLMFAAAVMAAGAAMAIESQIVGYQQIEIKGGGVYSMFCPTFDKTTGQKFTLGDIQVIGQDGKEYDHSDKYHRMTSGKLFIHKLNNGTVLRVNDPLEYVSTLNGGVPTRWGDESTNEFTSGEGIVVCNNSSNIFFRVSGQVIIEPMYAIPGGGQYALVGNNTPSPMKLSDIGVYGQDGHEYDHSDKYHRITSGKLFVHKLKEGAVLKVEDPWEYISTLNGGVPTRWGDEGTNTLASGESLFVCNNSSNLYFRLKSPLTK